MQIQYKEYNTVDYNNQRWYKCDGKIYPSITTILGYTQTEEKKQILDNWRARIGDEEADNIVNESSRHGTIVHELIEHYIKGDDNISHLKILDKDIRVFRSMVPYLKKITTAYGLEVPLYSSVLGVAGRTDCVGEFDFIQSIIDFKTSRRAKSSSDIEDYWYQIAFYAQAHNEMFGTNITQGVIIMGVHNNMPMFWKNDLSKYLPELENRIEKFYKYSIDNINK